MTNNDIIKRIRYIFNFDDSKMVSIFGSANYEITRELVCNLLKNEEDEAFQKCNDKQLAFFLNGLINEKRGKREDEQPIPEKQLSNNKILMKLKIALDLKAEEILAILNSVNFNLSKHELSAFFRKSDHKHFRKCKDQVLRRFLKGIQLKYRGEATLKKEPEVLEKPEEKKTKQRTPKKPKQNITQENIWKK